MDELIRDVHVERYYPSVMVPAQEFKAIAEVVNPELNLVWQRLWQLFLNTFVYYIDETGAARWESMLKLRPKENDDLGTRRRRILAKINSQLPYTYRQLENMLAATYGEGKTAVSISYNDYALWVDVVASIVARTKEMRTFLRVIIPANLTINVSNTQTANMNLYAGCAMQQYKHITVKTINNFIVENTTTAQYTFGGSVKRMVHITIRS
ncbi:MAG: hypothetical protein H6Q72_1471 [Firmicutes bacterium]|nr:hypothetical protein [Bacillota bacterium]